MRKILYGAGILSFCAVLSLGWYSYERIQTLKQRLTNMEKTLNEKEDQLQQAVTADTQEVKAALVREDTEEEAKEDRSFLEIYYLKALNNKVMVYREDKVSLFEPTEIRLDSLPDGLRQEIQKGKYLLSKEELYNFLENYSS